MSSSSQEPPMNHTIVIVIGISHYALNALPALPAAQSDAVLFAQSMRNWGVPDNQIFLLLNEQATIAAIQTLFDKFAKLEAGKLIFYFCGHGFRTSDFPPKSYLALHNSVISKTKYENVLDVDDIISQINKLDFVENYILMDACHLRANAFLNPRLSDEISGKKISDRSLLCLFSSGIQESFESETKQYGYFTDCLLQAAAKVDQAQCLLSELIYSVNNELKAQSLPLPETFNIGCEVVSFKTPLDFQFDEEKRIIYRYHIMKQIQNTLICNRGKLILLAGEPGVGKSTLCKAFESEKLKILYLSLPTSIEKTFNPFHHIVNSVLQRTRFQGKTFHEFDRAEPYYIIIIDHVERLNATQLNDLGKQLLQAKTRFILVTTSESMNQLASPLKEMICYLTIPHFSLSEGKVFLQKCFSFTPKCDHELIHKLSRGNPLKMKKIVSFSPSEKKENDNFKTELLKTLAAIYSCGFYINEIAFIETFDLQEKSVAYLKEIGLLFQLKEGVFPDPIVFDIAENEQIEPSFQKALQYWIMQLNLLPHHRKAAKSLIVTLMFCGYEQKADPYLQRAYRVLFPDEKELLVNAAEIFLNISYMTEASLTLAELLIELGEFNTASGLLHKQTHSEALFHRARLCELEILNSLGHFQKSIALSLRLFQNTKECKWIFHRGLTHFALGNWPEAIGDFTFVYNNTKDKCLLGRTLCMLSTSTGIRGIDIKMAQKQLEAAIRLSSHIKDMAGAWAGWNNLGEMLWKSGDYAAATFYLEKALEIADSTNNIHMKLETSRNLLHLYLRSKGPFSSEVETLLAQVEHVDEKPLKRFERMQILNAIVTVYLFRGDSKKAFPLLKTILPLTRASNEYHIYTLSNLSHLANQLHLKDKAQSFLNQALKLAEKGDNRFAICQIQKEQNYYFKYGG